MRRLLKGYKKTRIKLIARRVIPATLALSLFLIAGSCSIFHVGAKKQNFHQTGTTPPPKPPSLNSTSAKKSDRKNQEPSLLLSHTGNPPQNTTKEIEPEHRLERSPSSSRTQLSLQVDDLDKASLKKVIQNQLLTMEEIDLSEKIWLEGREIPKREIKETLLAFLRLLNEDLPRDKFYRRIRNEFVFLRVGQGRNKKSLFTGYYTPVILASPIKTEEYIFPLYNLPRDNHEIQLIGNPPKIIHEDSNRTAIGSWKYFTRKQIDHYGVLKKRNLEIAWLKDDLERFFLHIQGSGMLIFPNGKTQGVRFAGANKYSYKGIGKLMVRDGLLGPGERSMQGIKRYLRNHPHQIPKYLYQNKRYIFFSFSDDNPRGASGGELVPGRSIATDKSVYPSGNLVFIKVRKPVLTAQNTIKEWKWTSRFVLDQDAGSDIKGPGRADLYFGVGNKSGAMAGNFREWGEMYYLLKKRS